jgi:hypothetical protein
MGVRKHPFTALFPVRQKVWYEEKSRFLLVRGFLFVKKFDVSPNSYLAAAS